MFETIQRFKNSINNGVLQLGCGITLTDSVVTEALGSSVDFFWIDLEHTHIDLNSLKGHLIAARATNTPALVRVRGSSIEHIKPILDIGADGIIVPQVRSTDEVQHVVDECRYSPLGRRGFGPRAPSNYGRRGGAAYLQAANESLFVSVQIENQSALDQVESIAAIPGLDSLILGPYDLSMSMGYAGDVHHENVVRAMQRVSSTAREAGKLIGMGGVDEQLAKVAQSIGIQWYQCGDDFSHMIKEFDRMSDSIRSHQD